MNIIISIAEGLYLVYMFIFFKTSIDFNIVDIIKTPDGWWFNHSFGQEKCQRICPFGHVAIFGLVAVLLLRHFIDLPKQFMYSVFVLAALISLINLNAFVYLLPIWIIELLFYK